MNQILAFAMTNPVVILIPALSILVGTVLVRVKDQRIARKMAATSERLHAEAEAALHDAVVEDARSVWTYNADPSREDTRFVLSLECSFISARAAALLAQLKTASTKPHRQATARHLDLLDRRWRAVDMAMTNVGVLLQKYDDAGFHEAREALRGLWVRIGTHAYSSLRGAPFDSSELDRDIHEFSRILADIGERLGKNAEGVPYSFDPLVIEASQAEWTARQTRTAARAASSRTSY